MKILTPIRRFLSEIATHPHDTEIPTKKPYDFTSNSPRVFTSSQETAISKEIISVMHTSSPMENGLNRYVFSLTPNLVTSVLLKETDPRMFFRFFIWATRWRNLRCMDSHNLVVHMLVRNNQFQLFWEIIEDTKRSGLRIPSTAFQALIKGYADSGETQKAVETYSKMKDFDCSADAFTYNEFLKLLFQNDLAMLALAVHNQMLKLNLALNRSTFIILLSAFFKAGLTDQALKLFDEMSNHGISPDTVTYSVVLSGLSLANRTDDAYRYFCSMKQSGCIPNYYTYGSLLNGYCKSGKIDKALLALQSFQEDGYVIHLQGFTCLIDALFKAGRFEEARDWCDKMRQDGIMPDVRFYSVLIRGILREGELAKALKLVDEMAQQDVVPDTSCYNAVLKGLCDAGHLDEARSLHLEISKNGCFPDTQTYNILISGLCKNGFLGEARNVFEEMERLGCRPSVVTFNALITGLCKGGELREAHSQLCKMEIGKNPLLFIRLKQGPHQIHNASGLQSIVEQMTESGQLLKAYNLVKQVADCGTVLPNIWTYNILINGYCKSENIDAAFYLFRELQLQGLCPDCTTYRTLIDGLCSAGRENDAFAMFDHMVKSGCIPDLAVYRILMIWSANRGNLPRSYSMWLKYLRNHSQRDLTAILTVEEHFRRGEVEMAVRALLELDLKHGDFELAPYEAWISGLSMNRRADEGYKIFSMLMELDIIIPPACCTKLIIGLRKMNLNMAAEVFHYCLDQGFMMHEKVCNILLRSLLRTKNYSALTHAFDFVRKMVSLRYDPKILEPKTMFLLHRNQEHE